MALREFRLQRLDRLQDEWVHPAEGREVQAHVVAEVQRPEHPAHEGRSLIVDLLDLRLAGHEGDRDVELAPEFRRFIAVSEEDRAVRPRAGVLDPSDEFVVIGLREGRRKSEDLRILIELRLPAAGNRDEGTGPVGHRDRRPDPEGEGLRSVRPHPALGTKRLPERPEVIGCLSEFVREISDRPVAADPREDSEEVAESPAGRKSGRDGQHGHVVRLHEIAERAPGGDGDGAAPEFDGLRRRRERLLRVSGVRHRDQEILGAAIRRNPVIPDDLDRDLRAVREPRGEHVAADCGTAHADDEDPLGLVDRDPGRSADLHARRQLFGKRRDDLPHPSRVHRRDSAHVEHRRPHPARRNKDSASPGSITRKIVLTIILIYAAAVLRIVDLDPVSAEDIKYDRHSAFSISVNHRDTFTGVTDKDRATTIARLAAIAKEAVKRENGWAAHAFADEFRSPGHVPLLNAAEPLLEGRRGHTELTTALMIMAGLGPTATICEMMADDGRALSKEDAKAYARARNLVFLEGQDIVRAWRLWSV